MNKGYNYWSAPNSTEDPVPMSVYNIECRSCGGNHFSFQCPNPYGSLPYIQETYYQPSPKVQEDVLPRGKTVAELAQEHWDKYGSFDLSTVPLGGPSDAARMYYS